MIIEYEPFKYINTDYITHILPGGNGYTVYMAGGGNLFINNRSLDEIMQKIKAEVI